ncbi:pilus assembly PilX N-terminal domain-containing protein [Kurthia gibsonii]|uniref:pilus assembly PilX N-terminal domain-containing protein n=1 Tax=Kurthia gibsonii TaxID=33946 RepID=UPI0030CD79EA
MRKYIKSNDGYALVIALLVITVVTVLGLGILTTTSSSKKLSEEENKDQTAYYIAEAGLNQKKEELKIAKDVYDKFVEDVKGQKLTKQQFIEKLDARAKLKLKQQLEDTTYGSDLFKRKNARANVKTVMTVSETELKFTITSTGIIKSMDSANEKKRTVQSVDSYSLNINNISGNSNTPLYVTGNSLRLNGKPSITFKPNKVSFEKSEKEISLDFNGKSDPNEIAGFDYNQSAPYKDFPYNKFTPQNNDMKFAACENLNVLYKNKANYIAPSNAQTIIKNNELSGTYKLKAGDLNSKILKTSSEEVNLYLDTLPTNLNINGNKILNIYIDNANLNGGYDLNLSQNKVNLFIKKNLNLFGSLDIKVNNTFNLLVEENITTTGSFKIISNPSISSNSSDINLFSNNEISFNGSLEFETREKMNICANGNLMIKNNIKYNEKTEFKNMSELNMFSRENTTLDGVFLLNTVIDTNVYAKTNLTFSPKKSNRPINEWNFYAENLLLGPSIYNNIPAFLPEKSKENEYSSIYDNAAYPINFYINNYVKLDSSSIYKNFNIYYKGIKDLGLDSNTKSTINFDILNKINNEISLINPPNVYGVIVFRSSQNIPNKINNSSTTPLHLYAPLSNITFNGKMVYYGAFGGLNIRFNGTKTIIYTPPLPNSILKSSGNEDNNNGSISSSLTPNSDGSSIEIDQ